jgi:hypothetical protein
LIDHSLLIHGEVSCFCREQTSDLHSDDGDEISILGISQSFSGVADWVVSYAGVPVEPWEFFVLRSPSAACPVFRFSIFFVRVE